MKMGVLERQNCLPLDATKGSSPKFPRHIHLEFAVRVPSHSFRQAWFGGPDSHTIRKMKMRIAGLLLVVPVSQGFGIPVCTVAQTISGLHKSGFLKMRDPAGGA